MGTPLTFLGIRHLGKHSGRAINKINRLRTFRLLVWDPNSLTAYLFPNCGAAFHGGMIFRRVPLWETVSIVLAGQLWGSLKYQSYGRLSYSSNNCFNFFSRLLSSSETILFSSNTSIIC